MSCKPITYVCTSMFIQIASQLSGYGVRINAVCPTFVQTPLLNTFKQEDKTGQFSTLTDFTKMLMEKFPIIQ